MTSHEEEADLDIPLPGSASEVPLSLELSKLRCIVGICITCTESVMPRLPTSKAQHRQHLLQAIGESLSSAHTQQHGIICREYDNPLAVQVVSRNRSSGLTKHSCRRLHSNTRPHPEQVPQTSHHAQLSALASVHGLLAWIRLVDGYQIPYLLVQSLYRV